MSASDEFAACVGFQWDSGNELRNWAAHGVTAVEAETVFFRGPLIIRTGVSHSKKERRRHALGQTDKGRRLYIAYTIRRNLIRVISARDMNSRESAYYESVENETDSKIH